jgi:tetratricopeptide (TPR) repeat protein
MLPACLASARSVVDEMLVLDTGSVDQTRELARKAGARVVEMPWPGDFAAARNRAVLETRGDWVLMLDADERLAPGAGKVIRKAIERGDFDCAVLPLHDASRRDAGAEEIRSGRARVGEPGPVARLFRRPDEGPFRGIIHEGLEEWIRARGWRVRQVDADIVHYGALPEVRRARGKAERNLGLLERRCREEADNPLPFGYLAHEHLREGRFEAAREVAARGWERLDWQAPAAERRSGERLAVARAKLQLDDGDAAAALETIATIVAYEGDRPNYALLGGVALEQAAASAEGEARAHHLAAAASAYAQWKTLAAQVLSHCDVGGGPGYVGLRLGTTLLQLHRFAEALVALDGAIAREPDNRAARLGRIEALLELGRSGEAGAELPALVDDHPDAWLLAAALAEAGGAIGDVPPFVLEAKRRLANGWVAPHRAGRLLELIAAASACQGRAIAGVGRMRIVGAWLAGTAATAPVLPWERPDARYLQQLAANLVRSGQRELAERLAAACAAPEVSAATRAMPGAA